MVLILKVLLEKAKLTEKEGLFSLMAIIFKGHWLTINLKEKEYIMISKEYIKANLNKEKQTVLDHLEAKVFLLKVLLLTEIKEKVN